VTGSVNVVPPVAFMQVSCCGRQGIDDRHSPIPGHHGQMFVE